MKPIIEVKNVELNYPVYSVKAQSIRNAIMNIAIGGKFLKQGQDVVIVRALTNLSFELYDGDRLGIMGHNGAGKTTLLKTLAGVYEPEQGTIKVDGRIISMIDIGLGLDMDLTGEENVISIGRIRGMTTGQIKSKMDEILEFTELGNFIDMPMRTYSAGMLSRLVFGVATCVPGDVILMDEWIGAGDHSFHEKANARLNGILDYAKIIVIASHNVGLIRAHCNKVLILEHGETKYFGGIDGWDFENQQPK